jgi:hypothetical protein
MCPPNDYGKSKEKKGGTILKAKVVDLPRSLTHEILLLLLLIRNATKLMKKNQTKPYMSL